MPQAWGEPIPGRCVGALYTAQSVYGTAVTPATSCGICSFNVTNDSGQVIFDSTGQYNPVYIKPGRCVVNWSINITALQNTALITGAERTNGELPWITFGFGVKFDGAVPTEWAWQVQDCKIGSLRFQHTADERGGPVSVELSGMGGLITELSNFDPANITTAEPFLCYEGVLTRNSAAWASRSFSFAVDHNLSIQNVIRGAAPAGGTPQNTAPRLWDYLVEGNERVSGEYTRLGKSGVNLQANTQTGVSMQYVLTSKADGTDVCTIDLTGTQIGQEVFAGNVNDLASFSSQYSATSFNIT